MKRIFMAVGLMLANLAVAQATCESDEKKIRFAVKDTTQDSAELRLASEVQKQFQRVMNGAVCVDIIGVDDLKKDMFPLDLLADGRADLVAPKLSQLGVALPEFRLFNLPFAFKNRPSVWRFMTQKRHKEYSSLVESVGVRSFGFALNGFDQIGAKVPMLSPVNGTGLKFRLSNNTSARAVLGPLKATAVTLNSVDLAAAVKDGRVDAQVDDWINMVSNKSAFEHAAIVETNHRLKSSWLVGAPKWNISLNTVLVRRVNEAIAKGVEQFNLREQDNQRTAKREIMQRGRHVYGLTRLQRDVWIKAFEPDWNAVFTSVVGAQIRAELINSNR